MFRKSVAAAIAAAAMTSAAQAGEPAAVDWGEALRADAQAFHDLIQDSHPGPVDPLNPAFTPLLDRGLATALDRAKSAETYPDYYFAMQEFAASFDDGHLGLRNYATPAGFAFASRWPGFLTGLRGDRHEVVFREDAAAPALGATLVSCDGRSAEAVAAEMAGRAAGRWNLRGRRERYAATVFVDQGNPYVRRPEQCVFEEGGSRKTYALAWRDLPADTRERGFAAAASPRHTTPIELRTYGGDGFWIGLGSFNADPSAPDGAKLSALTRDIEARAADLRNARVVVFDLRGNNGGSSSWIGGIAERLWGQAYVEARRPRSEGVDWRVSKANVAHLQTLRELFSKGDQPNREILAWVEKIEAGLKQAQAEGAPFWRQAGENTTPATGPAGPVMNARAVVFTDSGCASACLDAVDLLTSLGALHVGQETSADTVYMEVRDQRLAGDRVTAVIPVKVYRGRPRGNNVPVTPKHAYRGDLRDTAAVEAFIGGLL